MDDIFNLAAQGLSRQNKKYKCIFLLTYLDLNKNFSASESVIKENEYESKN